MRTANGSAPARTPALSGAFKQGVLVLQWFVDGTRLTQLARDNQISVPTAYRYLHEGLTVHAEHAPDLSTALERAKAAGYTHVNLDGTVIRTTASPAQGPHADRPQLGADNIAKATRAIRDGPRRALPILGITNNPAPTDLDQVLNT